MNIQTAVNRIKDAMTDLKTPSTVKKRSPLF